MPRQPRIDYPGLIHHVYTRGVRKSPIFHDDKDRIFFMRCLQRTKVRLPFDLLSYCLMTNHYHLQIKIGDASLGKVMHYINTLYAGYINYRYRFVGHLFQNRYHNIVVNDYKYLIALNRYIHLNPVYAKMVLHPADYPWSSCGVYFKRTESSLVTTQPILDQFHGMDEDPYTVLKVFTEDGINRPPEFKESNLLRVRYFGRRPHGMAQPYRIDKDAI
jgi:putative transposase